MSFCCCETVIARSHNALLPLVVLLLEAGGGGGIWFASENTRPSTRAAMSSSQHSAFKECNVYCTGTDLCKSFGCQDG